MSAVKVETGGENEPKLLVNNYDEKVKVGYEINEKLRNCDAFCLSVAFINTGGLAILKQSLKELRERNVQGKIITSTYLTFNHPTMFEELLKFPNIEVRIYNYKSVGFHPKGYIFEKNAEFDIIVGSTNITSAALSKNQEWNLLLSTKTNDSITKKILLEFDLQWKQSISLNEKWIKEYRIEYAQKNDKRKEFERLELSEDVVIKPNEMQQEALGSLNSLRKNNNDKALLISATGTGKTYLAAFDVKQCNPKRMLFIVHRENIAKKALESFQKLIPNKKMGLFLGNSKDKDADYIFSTIQTIHKNQYLKLFNKDTFDYIIIDEVHRAGAKTYTEIFNYFTPDFLLGMTATPDRSDDFNIYELFDYNIAYEIRLKQALENDYLCPFHYYGISDISIDGHTVSDNNDFSDLVSEARIKHIIENIRDYGYSGDRARGLIFCSGIEEAKELSKVFNTQNYRTVALTGADNEAKRKDAIERLEGDGVDSLDYIFTVDIFNEGIDIPRINQIVMLRPTQSAIVFIQQLGRGLRKDASKEYVIVIDFIGNYDNNFMIPIALSDSYSYNKDNLRKFVSEGNLLIPGESTVDFDKISKERIFRAIDNANINSISFIKEKYIQLKNKVGHIPKISDFEKYGTIEMSHILNNKNIDSYHYFLKKYDKEYKIEFTEIQEKYLKFISKKLVSGKRIQELAMLKSLLSENKLHYNNFKDELWNQYKKDLNLRTYHSVLNILSKKFWNETFQTAYADCPIIDSSDNFVLLDNIFLNALYNLDFKNQVQELIDYGFQNYNRDFKNTEKDVDFTLYQKYSYEDISRILNWKTDGTSTTFGYKLDKETNTMPVCINYNKDKNISKTTEYEDRFINPTKILAMSKNKRTKSSPDIQGIINAKDNNTKIYLFVRKNKDDRMSKEFYYLGEIKYTSIVEITMKNSDIPICEIQYELQQAVRKDIYDYLTESIENIV